MDVKAEYAKTIAGAKAVPEGSVFHGQLQRPGENEGSKFYATEITQNLGDSYQVIGKTMVNGPPGEWIVINVRTEKDGKLRIGPNPDDEVFIGGVISGAMITAKSGSITLKRQPNGGFETTDFNFEFGSGGTFSGKVTVKPSAKT
jgi:hypothetical protein